MNHESRNTGKVERVVPNTLSRPKPSAWDKPIYIPVFLIDLYA